MKYAVLGMVIAVVVACGGSAPAVEPTTTTEVPGPTSTIVAIPRGELTAEAGGLRIDILSVDPGLRKETWSCEEGNWLVSYTGGFVPTLAEGGRRAVGGVSVVPSATVTIENTSEAQRWLSSYQFRLFAGAEGNYSASTAQVLAPSGEPMTRIALQDEVLFAGEVRKYTIEFGSTFYSAPEGYSPNLRNVRLQVLWSGQSEPVLNV